MYLFFRTVRFAVLLSLKASGSEYVKNEKKSWITVPAIGLIMLSLQHTPCPGRGLSLIYYPSLSSRIHNVTEPGVILGQLCQTLKALG
jgi:hypothetical protein